MNLVVLGATGATGRLVVEQALAAGHTVTALVRSPEKMTVRDSNLHVVAGQATDPSAVASALDHADALISTLGGGGSVISDSMRALVEGAQKAGVSRVIVLSSLVVERERFNPVTRLLTGVAMGSMIKDKSAGEKALRESNLDWTIVYASFLTDGPVGGNVDVLGAGGRWTLSHRIARGDVAAWLLRAATSPELSRRTVSITGKAAANLRAARSR